MFDYEECVKKQWNFLNKMVSISNEWDHYIKQIQIFKFCVKLMGFFFTTYLAVQSASHKVHWDFDVPMEYFEIISLR